MRGGIIFSMTGEVANAKNCGLRPNVLPPDRSSRIPKPMINPNEFTDRLTAVAAEVEALKQHHQRGDILLESYTRSLCDRLSVEYADDMRSTLQAIDDRIDLLIHSGESIQVAALRQ